MSPRYITPHEIIEKLNPAAYRLNLLVVLEHVHNVFHISQLRKYVPKPNHAIITEPIEATKDLAYKERLIQILDHKIKQLRNKQIPLVKVVWANHTSSKATWENREGCESQVSTSFLGNLIFYQKS